LLRFALVLKVVDGKITLWKLLRFALVLKVVDGKITLWKDYWDMGALTNFAPPSWMDNLMNADMSWIYDATGQV
ncbi:hypothetical protein H7H52_05135, partial [Mycolicibacter hiberniae]|nr:hypothetical protein [Mycolicibacter hiberniae]